MSPSLGLRIIASFLCILGTGSNALVVIISRRQFKKDAKAFVILMQIHAVTNALNSLSGWIVTNRHVYIDKYVVFISYGPGGLLDRRFCALVDCIPTQMTQVVPIMVAVMMFYRACILFNFRFSKNTMIITCLLIYVVTAPLFVATYTGYVEWETVVPLLSPNILEETNITTAYAVTLTPLMMAIWPYYNQVSVPSFVISIVVRILMQWKMYWYANNLSERTKGIHASFMNLLTLDALVVFLFFLVTSFDAMGKLSAYGENIAFLLSLYNYPIFNLPAVIQGISLLIFVPYLNTPFKRIFKGGDASSTHVSVVTGQRNQSSQKGNSVAPIM